MLSGFSRLRTWVGSLKWIRSTRRVTIRLGRKAKGWERASESWLYPLVETPIWLAGVFGWIHVGLMLAWDPDVNEDSTNLASILEAQAAMTAIFLAAMIFIVETVHRREHLDDPLYEEFLNQSKARWIFSTAVWLTIGTSVFYLLGPVGGWWQDAASPRGETLGLVSLIGSAFLALAFLFRALQVLRPEEFRRLRRKVTLDQVRKGAQEYAAELGTLDGQLRRVIGRLGDEEARANRAIDSLVEQTHSAVTDARMVDILEGMQILEEACMIVLAELENGWYSWPEVGQSEDQEWPMHNSLLAGVNRLTRTGGNHPYADSLSEMWEIGPSAEGSYRFEKYRFEQAIKNQNELFAQVLLECSLDLAKSVDAADRPPYVRLRPTIHEMLDRAARDLYTEVVGKEGKSRRARMATRLAFAFYSLAMEEVRLGEGAMYRRSIGFYFDFVVTRYEPPRQLETISLRTLRMPEEVRVASRRMVVGLVGYAVAIGDQFALEEAKERLDSIEESLFDIEALLADSHERYGIGDRRLFGRWRMVHSAFGRVEHDELDAHEIALSVLGHMWIAAMRYRMEDPTSVGPFPSEYSDVWSKHADKLFQGLGFFGWSRFEARQWCQVAFENVLVSDKELDD